MYTVEDCYIPRSWFDHVVADCEAKAAYERELSRIEEDWNAQLEESELFMEWKEEYGCCA